MVFFTLMGLLFAYVSSGCGQKGALYLPEDYELPSYKKQITKSFDVVEDIVVNAIHTIVPDGDNTTDTQPLQDNNQPQQGTTP